MRRRRGLGGAFNPLSLFSGGVAGAWYDPSDLSTLFTDSAGTTPVTTVGDSVGKILDKSGNGSHATQSTSGSRPTLQQTAGGLYYLDFDGTDDFLVSSAMNFTGTDKMFFCAGLRKDSDAADGVFAELSTGAATGRIGIHVPWDAGLSRYLLRSTGTITVSCNTTLVAFNAPNTAVLSAIGNISGDSAILRLNGVQRNSITTDQGTGNYGNHALYIGRRGGTSFPFNGAMFSLVIAGKLASSVEISNAEKWVNKKTGAY
jgi:hypothetical protein